MSLLLWAALVANPPAPHVPETGGKDGRIHMQLSGDAIYGIGGQSFLGALLHFDAYRSVWDRGKATGAIDFGAQLAYGNEPVWLAPWLKGVDVRGATHRIALVATFGHTFHIGKRRRFTLGTHVFGGWNHWRSSYRIDYPDEDVSGRDTVSRNHPIVGGQLEFGFRVHRRVGIHAVMGGPVPTESSYAISMFHVGLGLTVHLR